MAASNSDNKSITFYKLKLKDGDDKTPFFGRQKKEGDKWIIDQKFNEFSGHLEKMEMGSYEYKGDKVDIVKMFFGNPDGTNDQLEMNLDNSITKSILNTFANEAMIGQVDMQVYTNKADYPAISMKIDGRKGDWKYKMDQFPEKEKNKKGIVIDDEAYMNFMRQLAKEVMEKVNLSSPSSYGQKMAGNPAAQETVDSLQNRNEPADDLPFKMEKNYFVSPF